MEDTLWLYTKEGIDLWCHKRAKNQQLSIEPTPSIQRPCPHAREVHVVWLFGLQMGVVKQVDHMIPVLHEKDVSLIQDDELEGRQEIIISRLVPKWKK